ncbi:MAG TPA: tetratricopeptide repeat protein, partial [Pyrinomonadaceae bacterium]
MKKNSTLGAAGLLLLAALFSLTPAHAAAPSPQKISEADKQAQRGAEYLSKKDWNRAAESFQKAVRADARHVEANYGLGLAYMNLKRHPEALAAFSNVIAAQPNPRAREAYVQTGVIQYGLGRYKEAADALGLAAPLGDIGPAGHYYLGKSYQQTGRDAEALASLRQATSDPQHAPDANLSVGLLMLKQNRAKEAVAPLEQAVRLGAQPAPVAQMLLGNAYVAADRPDEALAALRGADPGQFWTQFGLGYAHLALYHNDEAAAAFNAALRLQPDSTEALVGLGGAYTRMTRYREAGDAFARALAAKADSAEALMGQAVLYYYQGQYPKLVATAQQAARVAPANAAAQTILGAAL